MVARGYLRGHEIKWVENKWVYSDNNQPTIGNERQCGYCGMGNTVEGHDSCLGTLPGVMNACCGHGKEDNAYVQFSPTSDLWGKTAMSWILESRKRENEE